MKAPLRGIHWGQVWFADDATAGSTSQRQFGCTQSIFWLLPQSFQNLLGCEGRVKFDRQSTQAEAIFNQLPPPQQQLLECSREKEASSWVSALPIDKQGFFLHKGAFRDAMCLRYRWKIQTLPLQCPCGGSLSLLTMHAMFYQKGGFPTLQHNEIRDLSVN